MTLEQLQTQLEGILGVRYRGVQSTEYNGRKVQFVGDAAQQAIIADLETRIDALLYPDRRPRRRAILTSSSKGL